MVVNCLTWQTFAGIFSLVIAGSVYAWDVRLECPEEWINGDTITLTAYVKKTSLATKCTAVPSNNTFFRLDGTDACQVIPSDYTCDHTPPETVTADNCDCADSSNQTFYIFVYQFVADKEKHNGTWNCQPSCPNSFGGGYLLDNDNSPNCANVSVTDPVSGRHCRDCERRLCPPKWVIAPIIFGLFRLFAILYFVLYVLFAADKSRWPFNRSLACGILACRKLACGILAWWVILLMCLATAFFPECVVLCIIDAILRRPCCCLDCISVPWRITLLVLAVVICLASIIYLIVAGIVQLWPFPEISIKECPDFVCVHEGWQIFLFVVSCIGCIGIAILICFLIAFLCKSPRPRPDPPNERVYKLLVKCGERHKWHLFSVTLDDKKLQNIFIQKNINEIFKKCANHDQKVFSLQEVEQKIQEILTRFGMGDIGNVTLDQTICLKDHASNKWYWYKQDRDPGQAVLEGTWRWSEGAGTEVNLKELEDILQIRLYLQSNRNPLEGPANLRPFPKPKPQLLPVLLGRNSRVSPQPLPTKGPLPAITGPNEKHS